MKTSNNTSMRTKWDLTARVALISGGSRGIGAACAEAMVDAGARVIAVARNQDDLDRLRANLAEIRCRIGPDQACIAALKGNAYGHGAVPVAQALDGEGLAAFMTGSFD